MELFGRLYDKGKGIIEAVRAKMWFMLKNQPSILSNVELPHVKYVVQPGDVGPSKVRMF